MEGAIIKLQELVRFQYGRGTAFNTVRGEFVSLGVLPACLDDLQRTGIQIPTHWFVQNTASERREGG